MAETDQRLRDLHSSGTLNKRLLVRIRMMSVIGVVLLAISYIDVLRYGLNLFLGIALGVAGFALGIFVFSRMSNVIWDEENETIVSGRLDMIGIAVIVLYILFDVGIRHFLKTEFSNVSAATAYVLATVGGTLLGRSVGTRRAVYRTLDARKLVD